MTRQEQDLLNDLQLDLEQAIRQWARKHRVSGSVHGEYNLYTAVSEAVECQFSKAGRIHRREP